MESLESIARRFLSGVSDVGDELLVFACLEAMDQRVYD